MSVRRSLRTAAVAAVVALAVVRAPTAQPQAAPALRDLRGVEELRTWFNLSAGHVRLILLLSPT
jgi:hypothetical protein